jgi:hypothetical protein
MPKSLHPFENVGTSLVFYELCLLPPNSASPTEIMRGLHMENLSSVNEQLNRLWRPAGIVERTKRGKSQIYRIRWEKVVEYALDCFQLHGTFLVAQDEGNERRVQETQKLLTDLQGSGTFQDLVKAYIEKVAKYVILGRITRRPEYAVGATLRRLEREIIAFLQSESLVMPSRGSKIGNLWSLLTRLNRLNLNSESILKTSTREAFVSIGFRLKGPEAEVEMGPLVETSSGPVSRLEGEIGSEQESPQ